MFGRKDEEPRDTRATTPPAQDDETRRATPAVSSDPEPTHGRHQAAAGAPAAGEAVSRSEVVHREREEHGGVKIGSAFFGWLAATGMVVLLSALITATGLISAEATGTDSASEAATEAAGALDLSADSLGLVGVVVALVVWFVAYYSGGYVAGRMARFDGIKQGLAVWGWSIVIAVLVAVLGAVFGNEYAGLGGLPDVRFDETTTTVLVSVAVVLLTSLVGAMLGGLAGMRFHRRVDRTGLGR